jgi:hypothetical protein
VTTRRRHYFFSPPSPDELAAEAPVFVWDEHERMDFDVDAFLAAIFGERRKGATP